MSKKQENRKLITQNKRNKIINKRYTSTIKTLTKLFNSKIKSFNLETNIEQKNQLKSETFIVIKNLYSIINTAARKKSKFGKVFSKI